MLNFPAVKSGIYMETKDIIRLLNEGKITFHSAFSPDGVVIGKDEPVPPLHRHVQRELLFVIGGESRIVLCDRYFDLAPGSAVLIDSWVPHSMEYQPVKNTLQHLWFYFTGTELKVRHCTVDSDGKYVFTELIKRLPDHLLALFVSRWDEWKKNGVRSAVKEDLYLENPMRCLLEEYVIQHDPDEKPLTGLPDLIWAVKHYIETRNGKDCSLGQLENFFGYNKFHIAHKFSQVVGVPVGEYINQVRLTFAKDAIARGFRNKEIAFELGFSSSATFCKWFKKHSRQEIKNPR